ncbi:MAG: ribosomal protein S18-alanine N-acetyltransferase [Candidatus Eremiobacteraeota bacterium]|nr:ribosomal protein S18-alanine N-acetyltransferase [Candidatus Eremiobacteraeota bacterium]
MKAQLDCRGDATPPQLDIASMDETDIREVVRIEAQSFSTTWPADAFVRELHENKLAHYFIGRFEDRAVAYGGLWVILEDSHVTTIAVDPGFRGRKFGEVMLLKLLDEAIERGASWITLEVRETNVVAQNLYRKYGFTVVSTRKGYYSDNDENALVMWAGNLKSALYANRLTALRSALFA